MDNRRRTVVVSDLLVFALYFGMGWEIAAAAWVLFDLVIFYVFFAAADGGGPRRSNREA